MKYLITESKMDNVVFMYLDNQDFVVRNDKKKYNYYIYFLNDITDDVAQISIFVTNAFGDVRNWVYVNNDLVEELTKFFSIDEPICMEIIERWVSNIFNMKVGKIENPDDTGSHHRLWIEK